MPKKAGHRASLLEDVRGGVRLTIDAVQGVTSIVEAMHSRIARLSPPVGPDADVPARGISGFVYRSIRGTTALVGKGLDGGLGSIDALLRKKAVELPPGASDVQREAIVSALNGVLGDHLERSGNPLATTMQLLPTGKPGQHVLLLIHGLCMNEQQWLRSGHDHGAALAGALGLYAVYARYNSGRHISTNGLELAQQLEVALHGSPVPVESVSIIGHSMGGLVARSALHQAQQAGMAWPARVRHLVFLGTPHHGAPLERGGNWLHLALGISPYVAPFARLSGLRSEGITDLRHGNLLQADWKDGRFGQRDQRTSAPLPAGTACYAVAGTLGRKDDHRLGDGLVPVASALGHHAKPTRNLRIPASRTYVARGVNHLDLLGDLEVYRKLRAWLS